MIAHETIDVWGVEKTEYYQFDYLPADPALKAVYLDDDGKVYFGPVLCWQIETSFEPHRGNEAFVSPVTPAGAEDLTPVLYPDGVVRMWTEVYESVEAWAEHQLKRRQEKKQQKKREKKDKARKEN